MNGLVGFRSSVSKVRNLFLLVPAVALLVSCGGDKSYSPATIAVADPSNAQVLPAAEPSNALPTSTDGSTPQPQGIRVQVFPSMSPNFDEAIHDYVVDCTSSPEIFFTASLPSIIFFGFVGPGETPTALSPTGGYLRKTASLRPGQRFQFFLHNLDSRYSVRCLPADFPPLVASVTGAPQAEWYLFAPFPGGLSSYVIITNAHGTPVWWMNEPNGGAGDAKIFGSNEISWTFQRPITNGGSYVIRDFSGNLLLTLSGNLDTHELQRTATGTYLAIRYVQRQCPPDCADMSPWGGSAQAAVIDAEIVELDSKSNVIWSWRTRDHIALAETGNSVFFPSVGNDIVHMNAIEPDGADGLFFSARHLSAVYHITKSTGAIDWKLGGTPRPESLTVIGDPRPTAIGPTGQPLSGQHDIRKWPDGTISLHDNGTLANRVPAVLRYRVDSASRTAEVVELVQDSRAQYAFCCGSARRLPEGHWLVQWGGLPYVTELDSIGNPVFTIQYNLGASFSYRAVPVLPGVIAAEELRAGMDAMAGK
jgi:hypothetical protein